VISSIKSDQEFDSFAIYNVSGQQILSKQLNSEQRIDVSTLTKGMYFLKLNSNGQEIETLNWLRSRFSFSFRESGT